MDLYEFHTGWTSTPVSSTNGKDNFKMDCPFCHKPGHFFHSTKGWDCKKCGMHGNAIDFLRNIHDRICLREENLDILAEKKEGCSQNQLKLHHVRFNPMNESFVIPTYNSDERLNNLYKYTLHDNTIRCPTGVGHTLFNYPEVVMQNVWVMEGHWDKIAASSVTASKDHVTVVGVPGADVFKPAWLQIFHHKDVFLLYDNNESGRRGRDRLITQHLAASPFKPKNIFCLDWSDCPEGFDFRDLYVDMGKKTWDEVHQRFVPYTDVVDVDTTIRVTSNTAKEETVEADTSVTTFKELIEKYRSVYYMTNDMILSTLGIITAIYAVSVNSPERIWFRLIGAPGSGKTTLATTLGASPHTILRSTFTGLLSGWVDKDDEEDASMIPQLVDRTLIVKDADALLRQTNIEKIFSEFRDIYDGSTSAQYRNKRLAEYHNVNTSFILCGTHTLRNSDKSYFGERFLDLTLTASPAEEQKIMKMVLNNAIARANPLEREALSLSDLPVRAACKGFINHIKQQRVHTKISPEQEQGILQYAYLVARMRTKVERNFRGQIPYAPKVESPSRLIGQLTKLAMCTPVVLGINEIDSLTDRLIRKVVSDTIDKEGNRFMICDHLLEDPWIARDDLIVATGLPKDTVSTELEDMLILDFLEMKERSIGGGRAVRVFGLKEELRGALLGLDTYAKPTRRDHEAIHSS